MARFSFVSFYPSLHVFLNFALEFYFQYLFFIYFYFYACHMAGVRKILSKLGSESLDTINTKHLFLARSPHNLSGSWLRVVWLTKWYFCYLYYLCLLAIQCYEKTSSDSQKQFFFLHSVMRTIHSVPSCLCYEKKRIKHCKNSASCTNNIESF